MKTSEEWQQLVKNSIVVEDPDGWDRTPKGWHRSWYVKKITFQEFMSRVCQSTCRFIWGSYKSIDDMFEDLERKCGKL